MASRNTVLKYVLYCSYSGSTDATRRSSRRRLIATRMESFTLDSRNFARLSWFFEFSQESRDTFTTCSDEKLPRGLLRRWEWNPPFENCFLISKSHGRTFTVERILRSTRLRIFRKNSSIGDSPIENKRLRRSFDGRRSFDHSHAIIFVNDHFANVQVRASELACFAGDYDVRID